MGHMRIAEGQPFSDCPSVDLKFQNFTPKSPVCHWLISEKNWSWAGVSVGIGRPLRKQNRIRQSPTPVPSCHRQYTVSNASQYNIQLNLEFCPHCPSLPTCGFTIDTIQKVWKRNPALWEWEGIAPEHARALAVCGIPLQKAAGHHPQTKIPHP